MINYLRLIVIFSLFIAFNVYATGPYVDSGETIYDQATGLEWQKITDQNKYYYFDAFSYCGGLDTQGWQDWRMPTWAELKTLVDTSFSNPTINPVFDCESDKYWTNSWDPDVDTGVDVFDFSNGESVNIDTEVALGEATHYVRCVRSSQVPVNYDLRINFQGDGGGQVSSDSPVFSCQNTCTQTYPENTQITLIAVPSDSSAFSGWSGGTCLGEESCTVTLTESKNITAHFESAKLEPLDVQISSDTGAPGSVIQITGSGFSIGETVQATVQRQTFPVLDTFNVVVNEYGKVESSWTVPGNATDGDYEIILSGLSSGTSKPLVYKIKSSQKLTVGNIDFANIHPASNYFSVWLDIAVNNKKSSTICSDYKVLIDREEGMEVVPLTQPCTFLGDGGINGGNSSRYRFRFKIQAENRAAWFENGNIYLQKKLNHADSQKIIEGLSVHGTIFDVSQHAWNFENTDWELPNSGFGENDFGKALADVRSLLPEEQHSDFNSSFGNSDFKDEKGGGGCFGLTTSAVADFNHEGGIAWGTGSLDDFKSEIEAYWPNGSLEAPGSQFKPFLTGSPLFKRSWNDQTAKKIMYYQATQIAYGYVEDTVFHGKNGTGIVPVYQPRWAHGQIIKLLKTGTPAIFCYKKTGGGSHAVAITQTITHGDRALHMIWDNNYPWENYSENGPYLKWIIPTSLYSVYGWSTSISRIDKKGGFSLENSESGETTVLLYFYLIYPKELFFPNEEFQWTYPDPHNFYNLREDGNQPAASAMSRTPSGQVLQAPSDKQIDHPDHIKLQLIGAKIHRITERNNDSPIVLQTNGLLDRGKATIKKTVGGLFSTVYLPVEKDYKVEILTLAGLENLNIIARFLHSNHKVEETHYDALFEISESEASAFFYVGRENTDNSLHFIDRNPLSPSYSDISDQGLSHPDNFRGVYEADGVRLQWNNVNHPEFSHTQVVRKFGRFPITPNDGSTVYSGTDMQTKDLNTEPNFHYYYSAFSIKNDGSHSQGTSINVDTRRFSIEGTVLKNNGTPLEGALAILRDIDGATMLLIRALISRHMVYSVHGY